jgi:hypothetical protein
MKKPHLAAAALVLAAACTPSQPSPSMDPSPPAGGGAAAADSVPLRRFDEAAAYFRYNSGLSSPAREVVRDEGAWSALWARMVAGHHPFPPAPAVDFGREMLLVAALGQRATGGYAVRIESVTRSGGELVAHVAERRPGPGCGTTQAVTAPADVVAVPRSARPVRWAVREVVTECS